MSINIWDVYITCPVCGEIYVGKDYHENTSSDNTEIFEVLNAGKVKSYNWGKCILDENTFNCPKCNARTPYAEIFTPKYCQVESLENYKNSLRNHFNYARWSDRKVSFSDWSLDWDEEPALSRLIQMYPDDAELRELKKIYSLMHLYGKKHVVKFETNSMVVTGHMILFPRYIEKVYLGNSVRRIGRAAFQNCSRLTDLYIPDSVEEIEEYAFADCCALRTIHLPSAIKVLPVGVFRNCASLEKVFLADSIEEIGNYAFQGCTKLTEPWIPKNLVRVGIEAFDNPAWEISKLQRKKDIATADEQTDIKKDEVPINNLEKKGKKSLWKRILG